VIHLTVDGTRTSERLSLHFFLVALLFLLFHCFTSTLLCFSSIQLCSSLSGSLFFDFKEKFSHGSGFLNHEAGDFMTLMRFLICLGSGRLG
jgi:hypothetical protein